MTVPDPVTWLFVPATRPERLAKAFAAGAHAVIADLEDAVDAQDKSAARACMGDVLAGAQRVDGQMVDRPVIERARAVLERRARLSTG